MRRLIAYVLVIAMSLTDSAAFAVGTYSGSGGGGVVLVTESTLPGTGDSSKTYRITNATNGTDCSPGTPGTARADCRWNGTAYEPVGVAATGLTNPLVSNLDAASFDVTNVDDLGAYRVNNVYFPAATATAINNALQACGVGSTTADQGCVVWVPDGTYTIDAKIRIGGLTLATMQNGIKLMGHGAGVKNSLQQNLSGTTLVWDGADGGTMFELSGFGHRVEGIHFEGRSCVDRFNSGGPPQTTGSPDGLCDSNGSTAQKQAAYGLVQSGDNAASAPTGKNRYDDVLITGILDTGVTAGGWGFSFGLSNIGQNDHTIIENMRIAESRHCLQQLDQQAVANEVRMIDCSGFTESPGIKADYGGLKISQGFMGTSIANATYIAVDYCATEITIDGLNTEHAGGDSKLIASTNNYGGACGFGSNYQHRLINNRIQFQATGSAPHRIMDWDAQGSWLISGNTWMSNNADANRKGTFNFPAPGNRDRYITMLGNKAAWNNGQDVSDPTMTITAAGGAVNKVLRGDRGRWEIHDANGSFAIAKDATGPFVDVDNDGVFGGSDGRLTGIGDVTSIGDCTTGACFTGASGTALSTNLNLQVNIDADNNTANTKFRVRANGSASDTFYVQEDGVMLLSGANASITLDNGASTVELYAPATGGGAWTLPEADGLNGYCVKTDGAGQLSFGACGSGGSADNLGNHTATTTLQMAGNTLQDVGKIVNKAPIRTDDVMSPTHVVNQDFRDNYFVIAGVKNLGCTDLFSIGGPPQTSGSPDGFCDSDGATKYGKTKAVGMETETVILTQTEGYGDWVRLISGGDVDSVGRATDVFCPGGAQDLGDESCQDLRNFAVDSYYQADGSISGTIAAGSGQTTVTITGALESDSKGFGEGRLMVFPTNASAGAVAQLVDLTSVPPGTIDNGVLAGGTWAAGTKTWGIESGLIASQGFGPGWALCPTNAIYTDAANQSNTRECFEIVSCNSGANTCETSWTAQGIDYGVPYGTLAETGTDEALIAPAVKIVKPLFNSGNDKIVDQIVVDRATGFDGTSSNAAFQVPDYPNHSVIGTSIIVGRQHGSTLQHTGAKILNHVSQGWGARQGGSAVEVGGTAATSGLIDGAKFHWLAGLRCTPGACETGFRYDFDTNALFGQAMMFDLDNASPNATYTIGRIVETLENSLTYDADNFGWGQGVISREPFLRASFTDDSINSGVPNGTGARVHWSQLLGVPAGFADGVDADSGGGGGTITAVGPAFASGAAFTDGAVTSGTTMLVWEGTSIDTNEVNLISPSANPGADINVTLPAASGTLVATTGTLTTNAVVKGASGTGVVESGVTIDGTNNVDGIGTLDADGAVTATSFAADPTATPLLEFNDTVASDTNPESRAIGDAVAANNGRVGLEVEENADGTYNRAIDVFSTGGAVTIDLGRWTAGASGSNYIRIAEGGVMTFVGTASIDGVGLVNASVGDLALAASSVDGGTGGEIEDGTINGEDMSGTYAGNGLVETAGSPDQLDIQLNGTGPGLAIASDSLSLIRSCLDGQLLEYTAASGWACANDDTGAGGGDPVLVNTNAVSDGAGVDFLSGLGAKITLGTGTSPDTATIELAYAQTLAGNPALGVEECVFSTDGTGGGGVLCEGSTGSNNNEQLHLFAAADGADTTDFIATAAAAVTDAIGASTSATMTNKTLDAEGTGNVLTIPEKVWFPAAGCNNATAASFFDLPASNAAAAACVTGTNIQKGVLDFDTTTSESAQVTHLLPSDWTGAIDVKLKWFAAATASSVAWNVATACVADAETDDPAFNTASAVVDAAKGTTNQTNDATITGLTATGCAAGELLHLRVSRDVADAGDAMTGDARLIGIEVTLRRAM